MKDVKAVIFDMDGVLVDSEDVIKECETEVLEEEGVHIAENDVEEHEGIATQEYFKKILREKSRDEYSKEKLEEKVKGMEKRKLQKYFENIEKIDVISKSAETVKKLSENFNVAVASNSEREMVEYIVDYLGIKECLDTYSSVTDVKEGKPEPDVFHHASDSMEAKPSETAVLEDSYAGTQAAVSGGYITYRFRRKPIGGVKGAVDSMPEFRKELGQE